MDILLGATLDVSIGRQDGGTGAAKELTRTQLMSQAVFFFFFFFFFFLSFIQIVSVVIIIDLFR